MIEGVISALRNLGFDLDDTEIADILWIAVQMRRSGYSPVYELQRQTPTLTSKTDSTPSQLLLNQNSQESSTKTESSANIYPQSSQDSDRTSSGLPIKVKPAPALRNQRDISRSLRPFNRRVSSRNEFVLDETATAERIAEEKLWLPVMRPAPERWLKLVLVIDEGASMVLWKQTIKKFKQLLEYGGFQDVRTWGLFTDERSKVWLRPRPGSLSRQKRLHNPRELIDPNGRRLFVIISDCVSPAWRSGAIAKALAAWACSSPMAIIQVLPEWLWARSALGVARPVLLRSSAPKVPNQRLIMTALDFLDENDVVNRLKVPIVALEPESLRDWAQMVASGGYVQTKGFLLALDAKKFDVSSESTENSSVKLSGKQRLQIFHLNASPMARKLAGLLASAPISLPIVRLIQQTMLPGSSQVHVAEVFLGGILKPLSPINKGVEADKMEYDFVDGVRGLLLDAVPLAESTKVLLKITEYINQRPGLSVDELATMLANPTSSSISDDILTHPFPKITAQVLRRFGGKYAQIIEELERSFEPPKFESLNIQEQRQHPHRIALISVEADPAVADIETGEAGGQNVYVRQIGEALARRGWHVDMFTRKASAKQADIVEHQPRCRTISLTAGPEDFVPRDNIFEYAPQFVQEMLKFQQQSGVQYSLVHTNYWISSWVGMELKKIQGSKQVHTYHSLGVVKYKSVSTIPLIAKTRLAVEKTVLETAEQIVATSPQEKEHMRSLVSARGNIDIIPYGTDIQLFGSVDRESARAALGINPDTKLVLYVGLLEQHKGIETLIRAVRESKFYGSENLQVIIGGGSVPGQSDGIERDRIEDIVDELGLRDCTTFPGRLSHDILPSYYAAADVCVVPSRYESFGLVAIEAMASGTPVIASDRGGLNFTVIPEETGLLAPSQDVRAFAKAIDRILVNPEWRDKLGEAGKRRVQSQFSWDVVANRVSELYKLICI